MGRLSTQTPRCARSVFRLPPPNSASPKTSS